MMLTLPPQERIDVDLRWEYSIPPKPRLKYDIDGASYPALRLSNLVADAEKKYSDTLDWECSLMGLCDRQDLILDCDFYYACKWSTEQLGDYSSEDASMANSDVDPDEDHKEFEALYRAEQGDDSEGDYIANSDDCTTDTSSVDETVDDGADDGD